MIQIYISISTSTNTCSLRSLASRTLAGYDLGSQQGIQPQS
ncbi:hypothetical protein [Photorhabdus australis]|nr:hypothetical protein [Photorhabdus australis]